MTRPASEAEMTLSSFFEEMRSAGAPRLREEAWKRFSRIGLPNRRVESWHYTDLKSALRKPAPISTDARAEFSPPRLHDSIRLALIDGTFRAELSDLSQLPAGASAISLREALGQGDTETLAALACADLCADDAMVALNAALMRDGVVLRVAPGVKIDRPIEIVNAQSGGPAQSTVTRSLALVGAAASLTLVETHMGSVAAWQDNFALALRIAERAAVELVTHVAGAGEESVRVLSLLAELGEAATLSSFALIESGGLLRRQIFSRLTGEQARVAFDGASLLRGRDHADTTLVVDHAKPRGESRERFRHIVDDSGAGVFQGKIIVRPGAQKTDGAMQSKAILLSDNATMNNKPELEIFADDVQCGHGATCGRLDKDQLFYLTARGIPRHEAEALLIEGFANEAFESLGNNEIHGFIGRRVSDWLARRRAG